MIPYVRTHKEHKAMNITLSVSPEIVKEVREYAAKHGTSLNQIIRDHLASLTRQAERRKRAEEAIAFFRSLPKTLPADVRLTRADYAEREVCRGLR